MLTTTGRHPATSPTPPPPPRLRLRLQPGPAAHTLLDGGWWPRSADPAAELPALIAALGQRHGPVTHVMPGRAGWDTSRPRRLRVNTPDGHRTVRLGWYATMPAGLLTATAQAGRTDLLTIPPHTSEPAAWAAINQAAQPANHTHTPALLAATTTTSHPSPPSDQPPPETVPGSTQLGTWEWEGGQQAPNRAKPQAGGKDADLVTRAIVHPGS